MSTGTSWVVVHTCHPSNDRKYKIGLWSRLAWAKSKTLFPEQPEQKRTGSVAQAVQHLPRKCEALNSNTNTNHHPPKPNLYNVS
jgi:hypothetical protein